MPASGSTPRYLQRIARQGRKRRHSSLWCGVTPDT